MKISLAYSTPGKRKKYLKAKKFPSSEIIPEIKPSQKIDFSLATPIQPQLSFLSKTQPKNPDHHKEEIKRLNNFIEEIQQNHKENITNLTGTFEKNLKAKKQECNAYFQTITLLESEAKENQQIFGELEYKYSSLQINLEEIIDQNKDLSLQNEEYFKILELQKQENLDLGLKVKNMEINIEQVGVNKGA